MLAWDKTGLKSINVPKDSYYSIDNKWVLLGVAKDPFIVPALQQRQPTSFKAVTP